MKNWKFFAFVVIIGLIDVRLASEEEEEEDVEF